MVGVCGGVGELWVRAAGPVGESRAVASELYLSQRLLRQLSTRCTTTNLGTAVPDMVPDEPVVNI
eukprot:SAG31_NODE_1026_length_10277_cov_105.479466_2_plen_65_part_00